MLRPFALAILIGCSGKLSAGPVPQEFAGPQSPPKPAPFKVEYIDQGTFDPKLKGILAPVGFKLEIVADYPQVVNPVGMTFGPDGTPYVLEWAADPTSNGSWFEFKEVMRYRDGTTRPIATMKKFVLDPCKQFSINPQTGKFENPRIIFTDELPSSLLYHDGWMYTASRGTVRRFKQSRPGGPWDTREVIAQGFCGFHHHQVSGISLGNDGLLYITSGDDDNVVEGSDGSRATVMRTGAVFRCRPDGSHMEVYSLGYRNPYRDLAHDDQFNWFHVDNDNEDGSKFTGCRLMHVGEGMDYGWRLKIGARCCQPDHLRGAVAGELPGKLPPMLKTGRGSPAGLLIYHDTKLPEPYRGLAFYPDVFRKLVRAYRFAPVESSFAVSHEFEFLKSDDPLFRPCQMVTGPDGAIYCVDWRANSGGAGKLWGDNEHGRIYRITFAGTKDQPGISTRALDSWAKILKQPDVELIKTLSSPDLTDRCIARNELMRRGPNAAGLVLAELKEKRIPKLGMLAAMGVVQQHFSEDVQSYLRELTIHDDANVRRVAIEALGTHVTPEEFQMNKGIGPLTIPKKSDSIKKVAEAIYLRFFHDPDPAVRRVAIHAYAHLTRDAESIVSGWRVETSKDPFLIDAYMRGIEACGEKGVNALMTLAESGNAADLDRAVTAFSAMRTRQFGEAVVKLLANPHASEGQRVALLRSMANYQLEPPLPLDPLADFLTNATKLSDTERSIGLDVLSSAGALNNTKGAKLILVMLDAESWEVRGAAVAAADAIKLKMIAPKLLAWATDSKKPLEERIAALRTLRSTGDAKSAEPLLKMLDGSDSSALKTEALRTVAAFNPEAARKTAEQLLDQSDRSLLNEAVAILGSNKPGAKLIGERFVDGKLPKELLPRVADAVRNFAGGDAAYTALYEKVMRGGLSLAGADVEKIKTQVAQRGNAARGRELYLSSTSLACMTCHRMEGVGGQIGPDLTRLWDTMTVEKILETIIEPSKEIKEGYQSYKATTNAGTVITGLKISETSMEVVIREATGRDVRIAKSDLDSLDASKVSLMPENAISQLSYEQLLDLVAFLKSKREQESLRGAVREYSASFGPVPNPADPFASSTWVVKSVEPGGAWNWKSFGLGEAYAVVYVWSASKQNATLSITTDDAVKIWIGGQPAFDRSAPKAGGFSGEEQVLVAWSAGWTPVVVKLVSPGAVNKLMLKAGGEGVRTAAKPEK